MKNRAPLNGFHQRKDRNIQRTHVTPNTTLPTSADLPHASKDLADALDVWHTLLRSEKEQARLAAEANAKADQATADYRAKVHAALAQGDDPAKIKDETEKHRAVAKAHIGFHNDARTEREKLGHTLGPLLEAEAPSLYPDIEKRIDKSAASVLGAIAAVRETWAAHSSDFEMRRWLSHLELDGGTAGAYHGSSPLPREVAEALATLEDKIRALDKLKADEAEVRTWRAEQAAARQTSANALAGARDFPVVG